MLLNAGAFMRLNAIKLVAIISALLFLPILLLYWFGPTDSFPGLGSTTQSNPATPGLTIPPAPSHCLDPPSDSLPRERRRTARELLPKDLFCRRINTNTSGIPKLFHQSWKNTELPSKFERWSTTCRDTHPDWEWVLWTDDDNYDLVKTYFPWLESTYLGLPGPIYRADFSRNLYMYMFGGVYADLDLECLRPTEETLEPYRIRIAESVDDTPSENHDAGHHHHRPLAAFGRLGSDETFEHSIPNAWMASTPRHPFFMLPIESTRAMVAKSQSLPYSLWPFAPPSAEEMTGPIALRQSVLRWKSTLQDLWAEIVLLPSEIIYPFSWRTPGVAGWVCSTMSDRFDEQACKKKIGVEEKDSLAVTFWSHTHDGAGSNEANIASVSDK